MFRMCKISECSKNVLPSTSLSNCLVQSTLEYNTENILHEYLPSLSDKEGFTTKISSRFLELWRLSGLVRVGRRRVYFTMFGGTLVVRFDIT